jgi:hypothetical protein
MIHTATQTAKFKRMVRKVRPLVAGMPIEPETVCVGLLERLWHATIASAFRGDIGSKMDDEEIAEAIGWSGDSQEIITILIETGWLDRCDNHRLVVHDWDNHAPKFVKGNAARYGGIIKQGSSLEEVPCNTSPNEIPLSDLAPNQTKQNVTKPNKTKPSYPRYSSKGSSSAPTPTPDTRAGDIKRFTVSRLSPIAERIFTRINYRGNAGKNLWKIAALVEAAEVTEAEIYEACLGAKENAKDPPAHLYASLRNKLRLRPEPVELSRLIKSVVVVPKCPQCFPPEIYE